MNKDPEVTSAVETFHKYLRKHLALVTNDFPESELDKVRGECHDVLDGLLDMYYVKFNPRSKARGPQR